MDEELRLAREKRARKYQKKKEEERAQERAREQARTDFERTEREAEAKRKELSGARAKTKRMLKELADKYRAEDKKMAAPKDPAIARAEAERAERDMAEIRDVRKKKHEEDKKKEREIENIKRRIAELEMSQRAKGTAKENYNEEIGKELEVLKQEEELAREEEDRREEERLVQIWEAQYERNYGSTRSIAERIHRARVAEEVEREREYQEYLNRFNFDQVREAEARRRQEPIEKSRKTYKARSSPLTDLDEDDFVLVPIQSSPAWSARNPVPHEGIYNTARALSPVSETAEAQEEKEEEPADEWPEFTDRPVNMGEPQPREPRRYRQWYHAPAINDRQTIEAADETERAQQQALAPEKQQEAGTADRQSEQADESQLAEQQQHQQTPRRGRKTFTPEELKRIQKKTRKQQILTKYLEAKNRMKCGRGPVKYDPSPDTDKGWLRWKKEETNERLKAEGHSPYTSDDEEQQ